jgi:DNA polymerase-3 subunit delta'
MLGEQELKATLESRGLSEKSIIEKAVGQAEGSLNAALRYTSQVENDDSQAFQDWMRACFKPDPVALLELSEKFHSDDRLSQRNLLTYGLAALRESLLSITGTDTLARFRGQEQEFIRKFSSVLSVDKIDRAAKLMNDSLYHLERNGSAKMAFMDLSLRLNTVFREP